MNWQQVYLNRFYRTRPGWQGGTAQFHGLIEAHLTGDAAVLELGPGPSNRTTGFLAKNYVRVDGLDIDEAIVDNEFLDERFVYDGRNFPLPDMQYDAVVADYVLEHIEESEIVFAEIARVLKPGGVFLFRTPNLYHYVSLVSSLTPHAFHAFATRLAHGAPAAPEPYPTFYRLNSERRIRKCCRQHSLHLLEIEMVEKEPSYMMFSRPMFLAGVAYERLVNSTNWLRGLRVNMFGACQRRLQASESRRRILPPQKRTTRKAG